MLVLLVAGLAVGGTFLAWRAARLGTQRELQDYFDYRVRDATVRIEQRMAAYHQVLRGAHGLFTLATVTRREFSRYVAVLRLGQSFSGIQGVGFSLVVPRRDLARHVAQMRAEGFPDYRVLPDGVRERYTSIIYLEPFSGRNLRAFGYDMYAEPVRREAMDRACDSDDMAISGKVRLVQETDERPQAGFLMYVPVFNLGIQAQDVPSDDRASRRANLVGWVYAPFRMNDLMAGIFGEQGLDLDVEIHDGEVASPAAMMFDNTPVHGRAFAEAPFRAVRSLVIGGRRWTVAVRSQASLESRVGRGNAKAILGGGLFASFLLVALTWTLVRQNRTLEVRVTERTEALTESEERFRTMADSAPALIWISGPDMANTWVNQRMLDFTGRTRMKESGAGWSEGVHPDDAASCTRAYREAFEARAPFLSEFRLRRADGCYRWILDHGEPRFGSGGAFLGYIGSGIDITEQKAAEDAIRKSLREKETLLREIHHRVKNNMQVVSSILDLQAQRIADSELKAVFLVAQRRVKAMVLLHEKLYQTKDVANIDFADYLRALAEETMAAYGLGPPRIALRIRARGIRLALDTAVPCALAVSELLTNVFKHGFPAPRAGEVEIDLVEQPGRYLLTVRDNGVGLPADFDLAKASSLGLQLVGVLARQLQGTFQLTSQGGVTATIAFPRSEVTS